MLESVEVMLGYSLLGAFGGYVLTSILLLKFPGILHEKKKRKFYCAHISHRGGAAERLENTIEAYRHSIEAGTQMLEIDVHFSKDKKIVVSHDGDLKRCTGCDGNIADYNYDELPLLQNELKVTFLGSFTCQNRGHCRKIPTLEEVFQAFPKTPINIDIKGDGMEIMEEASRLIKKYNREKITVWGNYKHSTTESLYKLNPDVPILFSMRRVFWLYVWFYTGLLPFVPLKETHLEIAMPTIFRYIDFQLSKRDKKLLSLLSFLFQSPVLFKHLKDRGIPTYLWVLNDEKDFETAFKLGAEGVMTDCPTKLTKWLNEHPQYWV